MEASSTAFVQSSSQTFPAIFWGGLISGIMDIKSAFIISAIHGRSPVSLLQSISSGLFGAEAYNGGLATAGLGLFLHFLIAFTAATIYHLASRNLKILVQHAIVCGILYGIAVYLFMHFVVLPLSAFPHKLTFPMVSLVRQLLIHMFCIGLPISLINKKYST